VYHKRAANLPPRMAGRQLVGRQRRRRKNLQLHQLFPTPQLKLQRISNSPCPTRSHRHSRKHQPYHRRRQAVVIRLEGRNASGVAALAKWCLQRTALMVLSTDLRLQILAGSHCHADGGVNSMPLDRARIVSPQQQMHLSPSPQQMQPRMLASSEMWACRVNRANCRRIRLAPSLGYYLGNCRRARLSQAKELPVMRREAGVGDRVGAGVVDVAAVAVGVPSQM